MNLLLIIFLLGLGIKGIFSLIAWVWNVSTDSFNFTAPVSSRSTELGSVQPMDYFRIRSGNDPKLRTLPPEGAGETKVIPFVKQSA